MISIKECSKNPIANAPQNWVVKKSRWTRKIGADANPKAVPRAERIWFILEWSWWGASHVFTCKTSPFGINTNGTQWESMWKTPITGRPLDLTSAWPTAQWVQAWGPHESQEDVTKGSITTHVLGDVNPCLIWWSWCIPTSSDMWNRNSSSDQTSCWWDRIVIRSSTCKRWFCRDHKCWSFNTTGGAIRRNCSPSSPKSGAAEIHDWLTIAAWSNACCLPCSPKGTFGWSTPEGSSTGCDQMAVGEISHSAVVESSIQAGGPSAMTWSESSLGAYETRSWDMSLEALVSSHRMQTTCPGWTTCSGCKICPCGSTISVICTSPTSWKWAWMSDRTVSPPWTWTLIGSANSWWKTRTHSSPAAWA